MARPKTTTTVSPVAIASIAPTSKVVDAKPAKAPKAPKGAASAEAAPAPVTPAAAKPASARKPKGAAATSASPVPAAAVVSAVPVVSPSAATSRAAGGKKDEDAVDLLSLIKGFTNGMRKRMTSAKASSADRTLPADFTAGVEVKDIKAAVKILNSLKNNLAPKAKGGAAPMNAFFYWQSVRHAQVNEKGLTPAETARVAELTKEHDGKLTHYMILSKLFNVDEYKKFDTKRKADLDITAKGFSLFRDERFPADPAKDDVENKAIKAKALPSWLALKDAERAGFEKRAKKITDDKQKEKAAEQAANVAKKEAKKKAAEAKAALAAEAKKAKLAATATVAAA